MSGVGFQVSGDREQRKMKLEVGIRKSEIFDRPLPPMIYHSSVHSTFSLNLIPIVPDNQPSNLGFRL